MIKFVLGAIAGFLIAIIYFGSKEDKK